MTSANVWAIRVPMKAVPTNFDPQKIESIYEMAVDLQIHRSLMRFLPNLAIAPDLAASFEVFDGGKRIRFKLAKRLFTDGQPILAKHVVRTFQRMFENHSGFAADLDYIVGARQLLTQVGKANKYNLGVAAIDDQTVEFTLDHPVAVFLAHLASVETAILPLGEDLKYDPLAGATAGPYKVKSTNAEVLNLEITAAAEKAMPVAPKTIQFVRMSTEEAIAAALKGEVDSLDGFSVHHDQVEKLLSQGWFETVSTITRQLFLVQNPSRVPPKVRDVIFDAVVSQPAGLVPKPYVKSYGLIPDGLMGAVDLEDLTLVSPKKLESRAAVQLKIVEGEPALLQIADNLKQSLKAKGVDLTVELIPLKDYLPRIKDRCFDLLVRSKFLDYPDGMSILTYFRSHYSDNTFFIDDRQVDALLDKAMGELNRDTRTALYKDIQRQILSHKIVVPVVFGSDNRGLWSPKLESVPAHPLGVQGLAFETISMRGK